MKKKAKLRYYLSVLFVIYKFFLSEQRWNIKKQQMIKEIIEFTRKDKDFFVYYTRILYFFMRNDLVGKRWSEIWLCIFDYLYKDDISLFEVMLGCLEESDFKIQRKIAFPQIYKMFIANKLVEESNSLQKLIKICCQEKYGNIKRKTIRYSIEVFATWANSHQDKENFIQRCTEFLDKEKNEKDKIVLLHLIGAGKCMTSSFLRIYCNLIYHCNDEKIQYYYGIHELSWLVFNHPTSLYKGYYIERKKFLNSIANEMWNQSRICIRKEKDCRNNRIAILVNGLHGKVYASTRLEIYLANELACSGYEVTIFVADSNRIEGDFDGFVNPSGTRRTSSKMYEDEHRLMIKNGVKVSYNQESNFKDMFLEYLKGVYEYNPDFIVDILGDQTLFDYVLIKDYPIITVPLAGVLSCAKYDAIIVRDMKAMLEKNSMYHSVDKEKAIEGNLYIPYDLDAKKKYSRNKLHIKADDFVIVTVGNRLNTEINLEFAKAIARLLEKYSNIKWMVIGLWKNEYECLNELVDNNRIILTGFEEELPALYKLCDVFINPIRTGGGGSIAMFIQSGLPAIISSRPSDILPFVGKENCVDGGVEDMFEAVENIYNNRSIGKELAKRQRENLMSAKFSVKNYADSIIAIRKKIDK